MGCGSSSSADQNEAGSGSTPRQQPQSTSQPPPKEPEQQKQEPQQQKQEPQRKEYVPQTDGPKNFVNEAVEAHNNLRAMHGAPPLTFADDLNEYSQKWADDIAKRDQMEHSNCTLPGGGRVGENIYMCWSSDPNATCNAKDACQSWYDEIKDYNYNKSGFSMKTGHFTQVVWKESRELGIAFAKSPKGSIYVVANYRPAGNMQGDFDENVLQKQ